MSDDNETKTKDDETGVLAVTSEPELAQKAANRALERRRAKLKPVKLKLDPETPGRLTDASADSEHSWLRVLETFAVGDNDAADVLFRAVINLDCTFVDNKNPGNANGAIALVHELNPQDAAETMLCSQMVGAHMLAMECMKRANLANQTFEGRELNMRHAERTMRIFTQQLDALNKHRGKGQQKVTVEHVTVNEGGQAVVGNVDGSPR